MVKAIKFFGFFEEFKIADEHKKVKTDELIILRQKTAKQQPNLFEKVQSKNKNL